MAASSILLQSLEGMPLVEAGDDIARLIVNSLRAASIELERQDVLVIAQKIVSKAEGRSVELASVEPSDRAVDLALICGKDPRVVELVLRESKEVLRVRPGVIIVEHNTGIVLANAGIDQSNVPFGRVLLLPIDPDQSASKIRDGLMAEAKVDVGVLIIDSVGRAWRNGTIGTAIGASGIPTLIDLRGHPDLFDRKLETTEIGWADELAAAASMIMGQAAEGLPVVLVRGRMPSGAGVARDLLRPKRIDLFR